jgi:hypothetical protein
MDKPLNVFASYLPTFGMKLDPLGADPELYKKPRAAPLTGILSAFSLLFFAFERSSP